MTILITGAAQGLGASIATHLAGPERSLVIHYRHNEKLAEEVAERCRSKGAQAQTLYGDFSSLEGVAEFVKSYGQMPTECIIHNVGTYLKASIIETGVDQMEELFSTNLFAPFQITQALLPCLKKSRGSVIHLGVSGIVSGQVKRTIPAYFMAKEGLWQLTKTLAVELAPYGVRVNMVSPGVLENSPDDFPLPMERKGELVEVARVVAFLLAEESRYITGQNIEMAGGLSL